MPRGRAKQPKSVETLTHEEARRSNLPSAEHQPLMREEEQSAVRVAYERRNRDLDPQLVWRGKDEQDSADLEVNVPPLYIQERVHPKALVDDLMRQTAKRREVGGRKPTAGVRGSVRRLQRPAVRGREDRVLPARRQLVEPHDPGRQPASDGVPRRTRRSAGQGAVHLRRPAVRHQVQLQLPVVDHQSRRA